MVIAERPDDGEVVPCLARCGTCSHSRRRGTEVATGWNRPRYSAGASGFMSHLSVCDAPPLSQMRIADFAGRGPPDQVEAEVAEAAGDEEGAPVEGAVTMR